MGYAGMDFVILDMEHGPIGTETLKHHVMAAASTDMLGIVRVENYSSENIGKALDLGAHGIQIPSVSTKEQAVEAVKRAKFFPKGERGVCRFVKAADYSNLPSKTYFGQANEALLIIQLEGKEGLAAFDQIIEVEGVDIVFIGPYDLSQSLGVPGEIQHPTVINAMESLIKKAKIKGIMLGTFCDTPELLKHWRGLGINYLSYGVDIALFMESLKQLRKI